MMIFIPFSSYFNTRTGFFNTTIDKTLKLEYTDIHNVRYERMRLFCQYNHLLSCITKTITQVYSVAFFKPGKTKTPFRVSIHQKRQTPLYITVTAKQPTA